ncbi:MAG: DNA replication and repair protein RecF [Saprospiraceae bacterium]|nr:DNA replication and repair protein RecF [Saprospiraceae bacterium]
MYLSNLKLTNFRNYETGSFRFHPAINAIVGKNGMGKTNILEGIYYLCFGKSYFASGDRYVTKHGMQFFRVSGNFIDFEEPKDVVVKYKSGLKKEIEVLGKKIERISDHIGQFLCVIISPDDVHLLLDGSEERRNFLNNTIVQTDKQYLESLLRYTHLLKQRNSLLKTFAENKSFDPLLLESITAGMYAPANYIFNKRNQQVEQIQAIFEEMYMEISGDKEKCTLLYHSQLHFKSIEALMLENVSKDKILSRTTQGIHKDDLIFKMNKEPLRNYASQGQLKSFIMALKLAQYKIIEQTAKKSPLILLDDIFDRLDEDRVKSLLVLLLKKSLDRYLLRTQMR